MQVLHQHIFARVARGVFLRLRTDIRFGRWTLQEELHWGFVARNCWPADSFPACITSVLWKDFRRKIILSSVLVCRNSWGLKRERTRNDVARPTCGSSTRERSIFEKLASLHASLYAAHRDVCTVSCACDSDNALIALSSTSTGQRTSVPDGHVQTVVTERTSSPQDSGSWRANIPNSVFFFIVLFCLEIVSHENLGKFFTSLLVKRALSTRCFSLCMKCKSTMTKSTMFVVSSGVHLMMRGWNWRICGGCLTWSLF